MHSTSSLEALLYAKGSHLTTIIQHKHLSMLKWRHRAGICIEIRICTQDSKHQQSASSLYWTLSNMNARRNQSVKSTI